MLNVVLWNFNIMSGCRKPMKMVQESTLENGDQRGLGSQQSITDKNNVICDNNKGTRKETRASKWGDIF